MIKKLSKFYTLAKVLCRNCLNDFNTVEFLLLCSYVSLNNTLRWKTDLFLDETCSCQWRQELLCQERKRLQSWVPVSVSRSAAHQRRETAVLRRPVDDAYQCEITLRCCEDYLCRILYVQSIVFGLPVVSDHVGCWCSTKPTPRKNVYACAKPVGN